MISWTQSTSAATSSSYARTRATHSTESTTSQFTGIDNSGGTTSTTGTIVTRSTREVNNSISQNNDATTFYLKDLSSFEGEFYPFAPFTRIKFTETERREITISGTATSFSAQITQSYSGNDPFPYYLVGTYFYSTTRPTTSVQTSTTTSQTRTKAATTIGASHVATWGYSANSNATVFTSGTRSEQTTKSTTSSVAVSYATTTHISSTQHVQELHNTIYQAQTDAGETNNQREVLWVATNNFTDEITPFEAAVNVATTTTRTTAFAQTATISLAAITQPSAFSLYRQTVTNESAGQTESITDTFISQKDNTGGVYFYFPPETYEMQVPNLSTSETVYEFETPPSQTVIVEYSQSALATQWFTSAQNYSVDFPGATHNKIQSVWLSREITTSTQNKYITDDVISGAITDDTSFSSATGNQTTSRLNTYAFEAEGNAIASPNLATFTTSMAGAAKMTAFGFSGALLLDQDAFALSLNLPNVSLYNESAYTALAAPGVTTLFPGSSTFIGQDEDESYAVALFGRSVSYTRSVGTNTTSLTLQFTTVGESAFSSSVYSSQIGGADNSYVMEVLPGAYKIIGPNETTTETTSGGITNGTSFIESTWWRPVSHIVPQQQTNSLVVWTAPRNTTNTAQGDF
jgi:hypothetical protein